MTGTEEPIRAGMGLKGASCAVSWAYTLGFFFFPNWKQEHNPTHRSSCSLSSPGYLGLPRLLLDTDLTSASLTQWGLGPVAHGETSDFMCDPAIF